MGGKEFIASAMPLATRCSAISLLAAVLCLAGCAGLLPPGSAAPPQAKSTSDPLANFGDLLRGNSASDSKLAATAGGERRSDANTGPMIYYGTAAAGQVISTGQAKAAAASPARSPVRPVDYVEIGVAPAEGGKFTLAFEDADINVVARAILGESLKVNYLIDPRVRGTVTLSAQRPVSRSQLLLLLETALRGQGAILVQQDGVYRILPAADAHEIGAANIGADAGAAGFGITALPLENISADALSKILDGFGASPGSVRVDASRNLLIVRGTTSERQWLIDTALAFDVDWMRNQSVGIFPVKSGSPEVIINELGQLADPSLVRFQPISRLNAVLAVSRSREAIRQVSTWIARLDRQNDYGPRVHVFRLKSADARKVVAVLKELFGGGGSGASTSSTAPGGAVAVARAPGGASPTSPSGAAKPAESGLGARLGDLGAGLGGEGPGGEKLRITADAASNAVVVYADEHDYRPIERAIIELDRPVPEVAIEAIAAEVTLNDTLNYGVQFYLQNIFNPKNGNPLSIAQLTAAPPLTPTVPGVNFIVGQLTNPAAVINALRDVTRVKILSSPSLVVADDQPALLQVGDEVPVTTGTATSTITTQAAIVNSVSYVDTGVILRVTPHISRTSQVRIDIEQEVSAVAQNANSQTLTPTISQQKIKSTVVVNSGQTVLLAGLISQQQNQEKSGLPGAIDLPLVGNILSNSNNSGSRSELIVFVRPQIIHNHSDAQRVAQELRRRMPGFNTW